VAVPGRRSFSLPRVRRWDPATAGWNRGRGPSADQSPPGSAPPVEGSHAGTARSPEDEPIGRPPATGRFAKWWRKLGGAAHPSAAEPSVTTVDGDAAPAKARRPRRAGAHAVGPGVTDGGRPVKVSTRSSVKAPPASPPIAKINPPPACDTAEQAQPTQSARSGEADAVRGTTPAAEQDPPPAP
jgi:hypothetical protein